jgi:Chaperone of endosialidase
VSRCGASDTLVVPGDDTIAVHGSGSAANPYRVFGITPDLRRGIRVLDSPTVNLTLVGKGVEGDPLTLTADAALGMGDLTDVLDLAAPVPGDVPVWVSDGAGSGWRFQPPPTVAAGTLSLRPNPGLVGDGSGFNPLGVATSGPAPADPLSGVPVYVDTAGQLRAGPLVNVPWDAISGEPTVFPTSWDLIRQLPTSFTTRWGDVADKPVNGFTPAAHTHPDLAGKPRYAGQSNPTGPVGVTVAPFDRYAVMNVGVDVGGVAGNVNLLGLRWDGGRVVARVDLTEFTLVDQRQVDPLSAAINQRAVAHGNDAYTVRHAIGPASWGYNRTVAGGAFPVWMDQHLEFGRAPSSRRYKSAIAPHDVAPAAVLALQPVSFHRDTDDDPGSREFGMIAEDVNDLVPEIVTWFPDDDGTPRPDGIRYDLLAVAQQYVLRDQQARIERLEQTVASLAGGEG